MSVKTKIPRELENEQMKPNRYCRGCILFLNYADQQDPKLMQQAGVGRDVYGHPVLILDTKVAKNEDGFRWIRVAVITSCGGNDPPANWAHAYLPIWPKAPTWASAPQLFLGEGRILQKESYVCVRDTWCFRTSMLSRWGESTGPYDLHLTRHSFNDVVERLKCPIMKHLKDPISLEPMTLLPPRVGINPGRVAETADQSNAHEQKQWMQQYLQRRLRNPRRVAEYLAAWEKNNSTGSRRALEAVPSNSPEVSHQATSALSRPGQDRSSTPPGARQPVPLPPPSRAKITSSPQSLTPKSVHNLMQRLQTISPPQLTKETHRTTKAKKPGSRDSSATLRRPAKAQRPSSQPTTTPMLSFYDFSIVTLVLVTRALWFFLRVILVLTYKIIAWLLLVLTSKTPRTIRVRMNEIIAAMEERLLFLAAETRKTVEEILDQP